MEIPCCYATPYEALATYKEGYLHKKEDEKRWQEYWVVLRANYLSFFIHKLATGEIVDQYRGCIKLNPKAKCVAAKRKSYSFPFYIVTDRARFLFKTNSNLNRHQWFNAIEQAAQGKVPLHTYGFLPNSDSIETLPITEDGVTQHEIELPDKPEITIDADTDGFEEREFQDDGNVPAESFFIKIKQVDMEDMQSDFLSHCNKVHIPGVEGGGLVLSDVVDSDNEEEARSIERCQEIYCQEEIQPTIDIMKFPEKETKKSKCEAPQVITSYNYPPLSKHQQQLHSQDRITRLTKSADSLRGLSFSSSFSLSSQQAESENCSRKNLQSRKALFSRHLVNSAPEVKSINSRSTNNNVNHKHK